MGIRTRPGWRSAVVCGLAAALAAGTVGAARADSEGETPLVLERGHIDAFDVAADGDRLLLQLKEDVTGSGVVHDPEDVVLKVGEHAWASGIADIYPGAPEAYVLPLTQDPDLIWPGWDTNGVAGSDYTDVTIDIEDVTGPGTVHLYSLSVFGEPVSLLDGGGYELPGAVRQKQPSHTHAQWSFSDAGEYTLTVRAVATDPDSGDSITSGTETYTFAVGDYEEPGTASLTLDGLAEQYRPGDTVELTAVPDGATDAGAYHWYTREPGGEWVRDDTATGPEYGFRVDEEDDGRQVHARLDDAEGNEIATSPAVTVRVSADDDPPSGDPPTDEPTDDAPPATAPATPTTPPADDGTEPAPDDSGQQDDDTGGDTGTPSAAQEPTDPKCYPVEESGDADGSGTEGGAAERLVLDHGHIDAFDVAEDGGELVLTLKEDVTGADVVHEPGDVVLHVKPEALVDTIPAGYPGSPTGYLLPLTQDPDLIWPGWDTNGVAGGDHTDVSITVTEVEGPGQVFLYSTTTFGGASSLLEGGGYELPGTVREETPAHTHAQWTFSEEGEYTLSVRAVATDPDSGESISSSTETYTFAVGDLPEDTGTPVADDTQDTVAGRTADGEECDPGTDPAADSGPGGSLASTGSGIGPSALALCGALLVTGAAAVTFARRRRAARG
ncbi:choice-of-anchor M domain-containing protein [Streptomyces sp. RFCAC02]|uniref:choice-of-anchor M domain-containing protein n=1 Tax=Streptomyces sp. RFCAC02 TaxID=2499143 RepID=UPI00101FD076|nr:choice-of-anchor M domain-containing protein [Streptomyces sp. RFCAC02]